MTVSEDRSEYAGSYLDVSIHHALLQDVVRTSAYEQAIKELVQPGAHVIDFGTGSGVLSVFAARAGAAKVDAIERSAMAVRAREICKLNGCPQVHVHHVDHESFHTQGQANLLVSEWMGHFVFHEAMLGPLLVLRDRWLAPGGKMLPSHFQLHVALVLDEDMYEDGAFLQGTPYGIDFSPIADVPLRQTRLVHLEEHQVLKPYATLGEFDLMTLKDVPTALSGSLQVKRAVTGYGLLGWFSATLSPHVTLGTGPSDPPCHWSQIYFPFPEPLLVTPERALQIEIVPPLADQDELTWAWQVSDGVQRLAVDEKDVVLRARSLI